MGVRIFGGVLMIFDRDQSEVAFGDAVAAHIEPRKERGQRGQRHPVGVLGFVMQHGRDKIRADPARDRVHHFAARDEYGVGQAALDGHNAQLNRARARRRPVFNGLRHARLQPDPADQRRGDRALDVHPARAHIRDKNLIDYRAPLFQYTGVLQRVQGGVPHEINEINMVQIAENGMPDSDYANLSHAISCPSC